MRISSMNWPRLATRAPALQIVVAALMFTSLEGEAVRANDDLALLAAPVAAPGPNLDARQQQLRAQLEPMLKVELSFAVRACKVRNEQREKLIDECQKTFEVLVADLAQQNGQLINGNVWLAADGRVLGRNPTSDPRHQIQTRIADAIKATLEAEQVALFEAECKERSAFQKQVALGNLVARLDEELLLSAVQREKITESLQSNWDDTWVPQMEMFVHGNNMIPNLPNERIGPLLTDQQRKVWDRMNKVNGQTFFGGFGFGMEGQVIDDIDLNDAPQASLEPQTE